MRAPVATSVAIVTGVLVLVGYFIPFGPLQVMRDTLLHWAVILAGFALFVGVLNLLNVHWTKIKRRDQNAIYSMVVLLSFAITLIVGLISSPAGPWSLWLFNYIQIPIEGSLFALLAVVLVYAGIRLLRRRLNIMTFIFLATTVLVLFTMAPLLFFEDIPGLSEARNVIIQGVQWITLGGARGILLGVSLGVLATGIRILVASDRPYSG
jgi:hypothetical protein